MWYNGVPFRIQFFMWTVVMGKISPMDNLQRKGFILPSICLLCYQEVESVSHLLLHCLFSREIWGGIMRDFGISLVFPMDLMALLTGWRITALSALGRRFWRLVPTAVCWAIWSERNSRVFDGRSEPTWKVFMRV